MCNIKNVQIRGVFDTNFDIYTYKAKLEKKSHGIKKIHIHRLPPAKNSILWNKKRGIFPGYIVKNGRKNEPRTSWGFSKESQSDGSVGRRPIEWHL